MRLPDLTTVHRAPLKALLLGLVALLSVTATPLLARAEGKSWIPELPPPAEYGPRDLNPIKARLPTHIVGQAFGRLTLGLQLDMKSVSADSWQIPGVGATFDPLPTQGFTTLSLSISGFLLHGHTELFATIPLLSLDSTYSATRELSIGYLDLGSRLYPWALTPGTVRPFVSAGISRRSLVFSKSVDAGSDVRSLRAWVVPVGLGAAFLTRFGLIVDISAQVMLGESGTLWSGVDALALEQVRTNFPKQEIDVSGMRFTLGVRWARDLWPQTSDENFADITAKRMLKLEEAGLLSGLTVALGPTFQAISNSGNYFDSRRRYLDEAYSVGVMPELTVGWHHDPFDAELRLAFRYLMGSAEGYGAKLETSGAVVLLEALKKVDVGFYGLTPWVGVGAGVGWFSATDTHPSGARTFDHTKAVFSVPFGWDYRVDPSSWWLLRTSFRWLPTVAVDLDHGVTFDHGGLEVNVLSFVVMPQRLMHAMRR